jgi:peptide/nickel transport system substrate-binding protein
MNFFAPLPEHAWSKYTAVQLLSAEESTLHPLGWGPYGITEWIKGDHITLTRNPNYFRLGQGLPKFTTLIYRYFGSDYNLSLTALLAGECDLVDQTAGMEAQSKLLLALNASGKLRIFFKTGMAWEHLDFGIQPVTYDDGYDSQTGDRADFFSNERMRQAIAYCLDRPALVKDVLFGQSTMMDTYLPPKHPFFNTGAISYAYDPHAIGLGKQLGSIEVGKQADLLILDIPDYRYLAYVFGGNPVSKVYKRGELVFQQ